MAEGMQDLADRFFAAIEQGDVDAVEAIYAPTAVIWHNTDRAASTVAENLNVLAGLVRGTTDRRYTDRRVIAAPGGFIQQHVLIAHRRGGRRLELPACIICEVENGRITRLDEYFDEAPVKAWLAAD
jgi:ketosteroid isomerase-like protein